jgi:predicted TIM-barrel fold metal-dependent hydrolase
MSNPVPPADRPWALDVHAHFHVPDDSLLDQAAKEGKYAGPTTARTVVDLIWAGVISRHPDLNLILAHVGGVLPVLASRILDLAAEAWVPDPAEGITHDELGKQLSRLYCDTAIAGADSALKPLLERPTPATSYSEPTIPNQGRA